MLTARQMRSAKLAAEAPRASTTLPRALARSRAGTAIEPFSTVHSQVSSVSDSVFSCAASHKRARVAAASSAETATAVTTTETGLIELNKETFHDFINGAGDAVVVVDFYTDWCGPCKLIYPELVKLSAEYSPAAQVVKFNCNQANKDLAKSLGIKVAPTFHLYKNGQKVADMTGAKVDKLRGLINEHLDSQN